MTRGGLAAPAQLSSPTPPRSSARLRLALLLVALCALVGAPLPVEAELSAASAAKARAEITVDTLDPMVVMPRAEVSAAGFVRNTGGFRLTDGSVRLRLSQGRLNSRAELAAAAAGRTASANGIVVAEQALPRRLARGSDFRFRLSADL